MGNWNHGKYLKAFREVWEKLEKFEGNFCGSSWGSSKEKAS